MPYGNKERILRESVNVGLWNGVPDVDAPTGLNMERFDTKWTTLEGVVPIGTYIPMCGMNLAFRRWMAPAMYFLLMGHLAYEKDFPYDRFGDIWCGILAKKIMDHNRLAMLFGYPIVHHKRASNVWRNLEKEVYYI